MRWWLLDLLGMHFLGGRWVELAALVGNWEWLFVIGSLLLWPWQAEVQLVFILLAKAFSGGGDCGFANIGLVAQVARLAPDVHLIEVPVK